MVASWMMAAALAAPELVVCDDHIDGEAVLSAIEARNVEATRTLAQGDVDGYVDVFTADAWQVGPGMAPLIGREAMRAGWSAQAALGRWTFDLRIMELWACEGVAVERGVGTLSFEPSASAPPDMRAFQEGGHYLAHWVKSADGVWRIRSETVSPLPPAD